MYLFNGSAVMIYRKYSSVFRKANECFDVVFVKLYKFNESNLVKIFIHIIDFATGNEVTQQNG